MLPYDLYHPVLFYLLLSLQINHLDMFLGKIDISNETTVTDIVIKDYRTATVFRRYGIDYCCGGKLPLGMVCDIRGLDVEVIKQELIAALRTIQVSSSTDFANWSTRFLLDYMVNVHHAYLRMHFPDIIETTRSFVEGHKKKYDYLPDLFEALQALEEELMKQMEEEEAVLFPYISQIAQAHLQDEPYGSLFVRTMRKPVANLINHGETVARCLHVLRDLTHSYQPAPNACITHRVCMAKLKELDHELMQHVYLETNIIYPRVVAMEAAITAAD